MSPHCRLSDLGPFRLRIFSAQVGNRTRAHGDESNPLEISVSSAMKGEPGLATGLIALGAHSCVEVRSPKLVSSEDRTRARAHPLPTALPREQPLYTLRHQCRYTAPPVLVHCATSAGTLRHQCRYMICLLYFVLFTISLTSVGENNHTYSNTCSWEGPSKKFGKFGYSTENVL